MSQFFFECFLVVTIFALQVTETSWSKSKLETVSALLTFWGTFVDGQPHDGCILDASLFTLALLLRLHRFLIWLDHR